MGTEIGCVEEGGGSATHPNVSAGTVVRQETTAEEGRRLDMVNFQYLISAQLRISNP